MTFTGIILLDHYKCQVNQVIIPILWDTEAQMV